MNERTARWLAPTVAVLAASVMVLVVLGPLVTGVIEYRVGLRLRHQLMGADLVSLTVLAPLTLLAAWLIRGRHCAGPLLSLATSLATWYIAAGLVLGPDRAGAPGNDEAFLPVFVGVLLLASVVAVGSWRALPGGSITFDRHTRTLVGGLLLLLAALFVFGRCVPDWLSAVRGAPSTDYLAGPDAWWAVTFADLALLLPAAVAAGVGLLRGAHWAGLAAFGAAGCIGLVGLAAAGGAWFNALLGDVGATTGSAWTVSGIGLVTALPALFIWVAVVRTGQQNWPDDELDAPAPSDGAPDAFADLEALGALAALTALTALTASRDTTRLYTSQRLAPRTATGRSATSQPDWVGASHRSLVSDQEHPRLEVARIQRPLA